MQPAAPRRSPGERDGECIEKRPLFILSCLEDGDGSADADTDAPVATEEGTDMRDFRDAKLMAKTLRAELAKANLDITHSHALELVARQLGFDQWNILSARIEADGPSQAAIEFTPPIPIFRIFDVDKAMEFYRDYLGFGVDFEHRFGDNFPLYCQVSRGACVLHLSEHAGDASPGAKAFTWMRDIRDFHRELTAKDYRYLKPGLEDAPWGLQMTVTDPFSNRIAFCEKV
jgi:uncharacterized glyoxalase superfamily protein PhnB